MAKRTQAVELSRPAAPEEQGFAEIAQLIDAARTRAVQAVNVALIDLYWQIGEMLSRRIEAAEWGAGVVDRLAEYLARTQPGLRGFTRPNLLRMRQFYEVYRNDPIVSPLVRQLPWTHNLVIFTQCKRSDERAFYLNRCLEQRWSKRELERQIESALYERTRLKPVIVSPALRQLHSEVQSVFKDVYMLEFLALPPGHAEADLHDGLIDNLSRFLVEMGRDFCFIRSEYPLQVGGRDFSLDLLLFHRGLNCLVAVELKVGRFEPEYLGKLSFYLEALDRDVRKPHEQPSLGLLLCASKDDEVVEYALSRTVSPTLIAEYQTKLPDKQMLRAKLHELFQLSLAELETKQKRKIRP